MTPTDFLDHYSESLHTSATVAAVQSRPLLRGRVRDFRRVRDELHARGVSDDDIYAKLREIMGYIIEHAGDIAAILALVLPLFGVPYGVPTSPALAVESDE